MSARSSRVRVPGREQCSTLHAPPGWPPACPDHGASTVDTQCGSSQQAANLAATWSLGTVDVPWLRGGIDEPDPDRLQLVEEARLRGAGSPSRTSPVRGDEPVRGAERIAEKWGISRRIPTPSAWPHSRRRPRRGRGPLRHPDRPGRGPIVDEEGQPTGDTARSLGRRTPRHDPRGPRRAEAVAREDGGTPPARRRRSQTGRQPCC